MKIQFLLRCYAVSIGKVTDVSKERSAFIYRASEVFLLGLLDFEYEVTTLVRKLHNSRRHSQIS